MPPATHPVDPFDFVVFGGTGDLTVRKLLPALFLRDRAGRLPEQTRIVGVARAGLDTAGYRDKVAGELARYIAASELDEETLRRFLGRLEYVGVDAVDAATYQPLTDLLAPPNRIRLYYLSCAPSLYGPVCENLASNGLVDEQARVVLEKPIGTDLESARAINDAVGAVFAESQIFRIDHYLGKESVQNLLVLRFANTILEPLWNNGAIDHVQITVAETLGVGTRGGYYDTSGALRDMVQNHLLQVLCLVAMEPPTYADRENVRDEKLKVLQALAPLDAEDVQKHTVAGQYTGGLAEGGIAPAYVEEAENPASHTETFAAIKTEIRNWRWTGVPFYLRTGKRMSRRTSEIVVAFKPVPHPMFRDATGTSEPNKLVISLQPDAGVRLHMTAKEPGPGGVRLRPVSLDMTYHDTFPTPTPDAYERLLMDVVRGDPTLFMRRDEVEAAWAWIEPILVGWRESERRPRSYPAGTDGPTAALTLMERDGRTWHEGDVA